MLLCFPPNNIRQSFRAFWNWFDSRQAPSPRQENALPQLETLEERITPTSAALLKDIQPGIPDGYPREMTVLGNSVFFVATDATNGTELWKSDGTSAGTVLVKDINPGLASSSPRDLTEVDGTLFFRASDGINGEEFWKSDGTIAGTELVKDINPGASSSSPFGFTNVGGTLFFSANDGTNGAELWKSNGTSTGTELVKDIRLGANGSSPRNITDVSGTLFFVATDDSNGDELWKSNGTSTGTELVKDINPGFSGFGPNGLTNVAGTLFFSADDGTNGRELWKSDGTSTGTELVKDINPGASRSSPDDLTNVGGTLFFAAEGGNNDRELWKSNGTSTGTELVKDIRPGANGSRPRSLTNLSGTLFFTADDGITGHELWKSNGTSAGIELVKDINPGGVASSPESLTNVSGTLFFTADDGINGRELWASNGTATGTSIVKDIYLGRVRSDPRHFTDLNGTLFFMANNANVGRELWITTPTPIESVSTPDLDPSNDSGNPTDDLTNDNTLLLTGTSSPPSSTIEIFGGGISLGTTQADSNGDWTFTTAPLADGTHSLSAVVTTITGHSASSPGSLTVVIDRNAPASFTPDLVTDTGSSPTDNLTNDATSTFTGIAEANAATEVFSSVEGSLGTTTAGPTEDWTFTVTAPTLNEGTHDITAVATDAADNSTTSNPLRITVDLTNPSVGTPDLLSSSDTGINDDDDLTNNTTPTFSDIAEAGSTVELLDGGGTVLGTTTADAGGNWAITSSFLANGTHDISARATDAASNQATSAALTITIDPDDGAPVASITGPPNVNEADGIATYTVNLSAASDETVTVNYATGAVTDDATPGEDYTSVTGTLSFNPGETSKTFTVSITNDSLDEPTETFTAAIVSASNATLSATNDEVATTITDNDPEPTLSVNDVTFDPEGNAGTGTLTFTVTLSAASGQTVTVDADTADSTTTSGDDYDPLVAFGLTFDPGETQQTVDVTINADTLDENNETFFLNLSGANNASISDGQGVGTIIDDDAPPTVSIGDAADVVEGNAATFTVTLSGASGKDVTVNFGTAGGTATSGSDFPAQSGSITIAAGSLTGDITINTTDDAFDEADDETFFVNLIGVLNANVVDAQAQGQIDDNDPTPTVSISAGPATVEEGATTVDYTVQLSAPSGQTVTVAFNAGAGPDPAALPGQDFIATGGTLTFAPGETTKVVSVPIVGDAVDEPDENFTFTITPGAGVAGGTPLAVTTVILDDDEPTPSDPTPEDDPAPPTPEPSDPTPTPFRDVVAVGADAGGGPLIRLFDSDVNLLSSFFAFDGLFDGGVHVAMGDVNGDGVEDIIAGAGAGGGPHVQIFSGVDLSLIIEFFAYDPGFAGGVFVASGDINADGIDDVITGAGAGGGPHVKVFGGGGAGTLADFFAYIPGFAGGVRVSSGDVNGNGFDDVITAAGPGGTPHVRVFDGGGAGILADFMAFELSHSGGVFVSGADLTGDGLAAVIASRGAGSPTVRVFDGPTLAPVSAFDAFESSFTGGVRVGAIDADEDGIAEIVAGRGPSLVAGSASPSLVRYLSADGLTVLGEFNVFDAAFLGGVFVN